MKTYKAADVAKWFINRAADDVIFNKGGEYISHLKLQKLLYYAQGCFGAMKNRPLFNDKIECWAHGPVVPSVYNTYKGVADNVITSAEIVDVDCETAAVLEEVYKVFGQYSAWALRNMTHQEDPWKKTEANQEISFDCICEYFKRNYIEE